MSLFRASFLETLRETYTPSQWPGVLADPEQPAVRERVELAVATLPSPVRVEMEALLTSGTARELHLGRALLWGMALAGQSGVRPEGLSADGVARMVTPAGERFHLAPLLFDTGEHRAGSPDDVARLVRSLETVFDRTPFALQIRKPLGPGVDLAPVTRAVRLWLMAVRRGEWHGRHAVYDDADVTIELTLLELPERDEGSPLAFYVDPPVALERLAVVDAQLQALARLHQDDAGGEPLVPLLVAQPAWSITRGFMMQLLYGTPDQVDAWSAAGGASYRARYRQPRYCLYSDPLFRDLAALCWLEEHGDDPLAFSAWSHDNPWCSSAAAIPPLPGTRYRRLLPAEAGELADDEVAMTWEDQPPAPQR